MYLLFLIALRVQEVGKPKEGDTVLVSGAAGPLPTVFVHFYHLCCCSGATGSIVGQIAKIKGCRVGAVCCVMCCLVCCVC